MTGLKAFLFITAFMLMLHTTTFSVAAEPALQQKTVGGKTYTVQLLVKDNFANLDNWVVEAQRSGKIKVNNHTLQCDTRGFGATIWNKTQVVGPSMIEYDVQSLEGKNNLNGIFYGSIMQQNRETLFTTTKQRTGAYREYHVFQNYIVTYVSPERDNVWRVRFRKDPGFNLLSETRVNKAFSPDEYRRMTYIFESDGTMRLYVNDRLLHAIKDADNPYGLGYHALRTWETRVNYKNFKIYRIVPPSPNETDTPHAPTDLKIIRVVPQ